MPNIIHIGRLHAAATKLEAIRAQLDEMIDFGACGCGECDICHSLCMLAVDTDNLARVCRASAVCGDSYFEPASA